MEYDIFTFDCSARRSISFKIIPVTPLPLCFSLKIDEKYEGHLLSAQN